MYYISMMIKKPTRKPKPKPAVGGKTTKPVKGLKSPVKNLTPQQRAKKKAAKKASGMIAGAKQSGSNRMFYPK